VCAVYKKEKKTWVESLTYCAAVSLFFFKE